MTNWLLPIKSKQKNIILRTVKRDNKTIIFRKISAIDEIMLLCSFIILSMGYFYQTTTIDFASWLIFVVTRPTTAEIVETLAKIIN